MRLRTKALLALVVLFVVPAATVLIALHSSTATGYALRAAINRVEGLSLGDVEGTLGQGLTLRNLHYANDAIDVRIQRLHLTAALGALARGEIVIHELAANGIRATPNANAPATPPAALSVPELAAPLPLLIERVTIKDALWTPLPDMPVESLVAKLQWRGTAFTIASAQLSTPTLKARLEADVDTHGDVPLVSSLTWSYPEPALSGKLETQGTLADLNVTHALEGAYTLNSHGTLAALNRIEPFIELQHTCPEPCVINDVAIEQGQLAHSGTPSESNIELAALISAGPLTRNNVRGDLQFKDGKFEIRALSASGDAFEANLGGTLNPAAGPSFAVTGNLTRLDASLLNAAAEGSIAATFSASGDNPQSLRAELREVTGLINGFALSGRGNVQRAGDQLIIDDASVALGDNALNIRGIATPGTLDLEADIEMPTLAQIDPRLSGALQASARVTGSQQSPQIKASGNATSLTLNEFSLASAEFNLDVDAARQVSGALNTRQMQRAQRALGALDVRLDGSLDALGIAATLDHPQVNAKLDSTLTTSDDARVLQVKDATVDATAIGIWSLQDAFEISSGRGTLAVTPHLWQSGAAFARVTRLQQEQDDVSVGVELAQLPLALAAGFMPPDVSIAGTIDAQVDVEKRDGSWRGNINWEQDGTILKMRASEGSRRLALPVVSAQVQQTPDGAMAQLTIKGDFGLNVAANLTATNTAALAESPITGSVQADMDDVSWLTPWLGGVSDLAGTLKTQLSISGRLSEPALTGSVTFEDGALAYTDAGLQLEQMTLVARATDAAAITLEGAANSGGGALRFDGQIKQPWTQARTLSLAVTGKDVQAFNAADYQLWLSPDLTLTAAADGARISGNMRVPRADIRVRELPPDVVRSSDDIVVAGRETKARFSLPFDGDLQVTLGDDVHVFALGLDADVGGDLRVRLNADQAPRLAGRIFLKDGRYAAYGQKLDIERGNLIYAGPIANPTLDIRAARTIDDAGTPIAAGVMVSGPASTPEISIFTDPATSQTDALSYLLLGRAAADTSGVEGEALSQAALAIGMSQSSPLTTRLASGLGLDELTVGGDNVEAAELVAGKQLNDRLYIRYSYGVFSNLGAILLRYRLSRRLALEAGSSDVQSIDILYTIEK